MNTGAPCHHCYCSTNTAGQKTCCKCGSALESVAQILERHCGQVISELDKIIEKVKNG